MKLSEMFNFKTPAWVTVVISIIVAVCAFGMVLLNGGETAQKITAPNGAEYLVDFQLNDGLLELIEKCDIKEVGDKCDIKIGVDVTLLVAPKVEAKKEDVKEESKAEEKTEEPVKEESKAEEAKPAETESKAEEPKKEESKESAEQTEKK